MWRPARPAICAISAGAQPARRLAVELDDAREGDMVEIHVEAHADRVGGDEIIDLARLEQSDLRVARARRQRAQDHGGAAALAPHQLGQREHVGDGEGDDGAARRQARHLLGADIAQGGKARAADELRLGHEPPQQRADRVGAEQHGLGQAARVQQPVGEDMAALGVAAELDLVDGEEIDRPVERHRFDGADEIGGIGRDDLLFAGDERHRALALERNDAVVVLAGQQPQREADHSGAVAEHALDGEMGLAGIGRPENGQDARGVRKNAHHLSIGAPAAKGKGRWIATR